ncbi:hypothetical protein MKP05_13660 [Halomonas sp. EGI 63088]|uniref:Hint domain-containing protein n=1 Tax=Halomonas flagellata TaxID=2920385 RepID=A0ABS9RWF9_9GAMM|nr:hypothetical protein [Halomonas flagellata]MCH4564159.1 hypothetical protein [Halomonas flagellata]
MASQSCLNNIQKKGGRYCEGNHCASIQGDINEYCEHSGLGGDVPVPQVDDRGKCWCCCSCAAWGTPVEVSPGNYRMIELIRDGDTVLATGGKLQNWEKYEVTDLGGIAPGVPLDFCYFGRFTLENGEVRQLVTTADHLFLLPNGKLKPIQDLRPGDTVVQADGAKATVAFVAIGQFSGGVRNFALGPFDPKAHPDDPYKGHLINTFGLVTADLAVQMAFYGEEFSTDMVETQEDNVPPIGSKGFFDKHNTQAYEAFINDPEQWPVGFAATTPPLFNIPPSSLAYFTKDQAGALAEAEPDQNQGDSQAMANFKYLKRLFSGFYPGIYFAADWSDDSVNAWYFNSGDQPYIILSGGLLRFPTLNVPGVSMVMCHMIANHEGHGCQGDADYHGSAIQFREVWFDELYFDQFDKAFAEIQATFAQVPAKYAKENPDNLCRQPSLECREEAIANGQSFRGTPSCAKPPPAFAVTGAEAPRLGQVEVSFSTTLFAPTATDPAHYSISEDVEVLQADYNEGETCVTLTTQPMRPSVSYEVTVKGVLSERGQRLDRDQNTASFQTP